MADQPESGPGPSAQSEGDERRAALLGGVSALLMVSAAIAARASRDALFLSEFPVTDLPKAVIAGGLMTILATFAISGVLGRHGPARVVPGLFATSALLLVLNFALLAVSPKAGAVLLYLLVAVLSPLLVSGFWSTINERFDPRTARRVVGRIAAMGALGGVIGGLTATALGGWLGAESVLVLLATLHAAAAFTVRAVGGPERHPSDAQQGAGGAWAGVRTVRESAFLRQMATVVVLVFVADTLIDYALKREAAQVFASSEALIGFFALYYTISGAVTFLVQIGAGARILENFGLGAAMAFLPLGVVLTAGTAALLPRLATLVVARGTEAVLSNSLFRSGFELLYTPLPNHVKRPSKPLIDVAGQRLGDVLGGGLLLALIALLGTLPAGLAPGLAVGIACVIAYLVNRLHRGYVDQLASRLREGELRLDETIALDATTARTLAESRMGLDRSSILREIAAQRERLGGASPGASTPRPAEDGEVEAGLAGAGTLHQSAPQPDRDADAGAGAGAGDEALLEHAPVDPVLVAQAVERLADERTARDASRYLRRAAQECTGQLGDALVDRDRPAPTRRRIARLLGDCQGARALSGLTAVLADPDFEVRSRAARAALRIIRRDPALALPEPSVYTLVEAELAREVEADRGDGAIPAPIRHVFTLLALALEPELMGSVLRGLYADHPHVRGTALEFVEVSLPSTIQRLLLARVEARAASAPTSGTTEPTRSSAELAETLRREAAGESLEDA